MEPDDLSFQVNATRLDDLLRLIADRPVLALQYDSEVVEKLLRLRSLRPNQRDQVLIQFYAWTMECIPRYLKADYAQVPHLQHLMRRVSAEVGPYPEQ